MCLLIDVLTNRKILLMALKKEGYESDLAKDGQEAIDLYKHDQTTDNFNEYSLIFMDNTMPIMVSIALIAYLLYEFIIQKFISFNFLFL